MSIVDLERIKETSDGDTEFEIELIEMYLEDAKENVDLIKKALDTQNSDELKHAAHTLKGSSANIGAIATEKAALALERRGGENNFNDTSSDLSALEEAFQATNTYFTDYVSSIS